ncbi:hypothetical protein FHU36_004418 [Nonomuraea muscovyensis]|uniref:Uncharacterized protein n=1 Tax=Nonomuraea muscovyensis TaxID=1124761 RepID=A0A7X0C481_9ACTN|nr:hypothetical protein [Nonomuraea muscovyensis]MBB6347873.1 hypothetical protein [Nonomuraea muscovyensis]
MHPHPRFQNLPAIPHEVVVETLERALRDRSQEGEAANVLVGIALYDNDQAFVEHWCMEVGTRAMAGSRLLGLAGLCLGHTARRFRYLRDEALARRPLVADVVDHLSVTRRSAGLTRLHRRERQAVLGRSGLHDLLDLPALGQRERLRAAILALGVERVEAVGVWSTSRTRSGQVDVTVAILATSIALGGHTPPELESGRRVTTGRRSPDAALDGTSLLSGR